MKQKKWTGNWNGQSFDFKKVGLKSSFLDDLYHNLLKAHWISLLCIFFTGYMTINFIFASLYYFTGDNLTNVHPESFWDAFVFSFQTSASIGYGHYLPKTNLAHAIVILDSMSGILFVALATGLAIGKFSRPTAKVLFSKNLLINNRNGKRTLVFRIGNSRDSQIVDAELKVAVAFNEVTHEGEKIRRLYDLDLARSRSPLFALSWLAMHEIDSSSPLSKFSEQDICDQDVFFVVTLNGIDDVFSQLVYDRHTYLGSDIVLDKYFVDMMGEDEQGSFVIDYKKFDDLKSL